MAKKNYNLLIGVCALVAVILIVSVAGYFVSRPKAVVIQGEAEATEYRVSGKVPGRIEEFRAQEGQAVRRGDTLVLIDSPEIRSKIAEANAAREANEAKVASDQEIAEKQNELAIKKAELKVQADTKKAEADAAYEIQKQEQQKSIRI